MRADAQGVLVDDIAVLWGEALGVVHVPAESGEEGVEEFLAELGLIVTTGTVVIAVVGEGFAELEDGVGSGHGNCRTLRKRAGGGKGIGFRIEVSSTFLGALPR